MIVESGLDFRIECLSIDDLSDLAAGIVPHEIQVTALRLLDWDDLLRRNGEKPVKSRRRTEVKS
jgi:hypothetical protein